MFHGPPIPHSIAEVLNQYPSLVQPLEPPALLGNAGGSSGSILWRFRSRLGELVLKRWPKPETTRARLLRNHEWLHRAGTLPFVPLPIASERFGSVVEMGTYLWDLTRRLPGVPPSENPVVAAQVDQAFHALARFHEALAESSTTGPSPGLIARRNELKGWLANDFDRLQARLETHPSGLYDELGRDWLTLGRPLAPRIERLLDKASATVVRLQPVIKDARREHWLFEGNRLSGLVDFGAMDVDSVAADLSRLADDWFIDDPGMVRRAFQAYQSVRLLDPAELALIPSFSQSADLLTAGHWFRWLVFEGRVFDSAAMVKERLERGLQRLRRLSTES